MKEIVFEFPSIVIIKCSIWMIPIFDSVSPASSTQPNSLYPHQLMMSHPREHVLLCSHRDGLCRLEDHLPLMHKVETKYNNLMNTQTNQCLQSPSTPILLCRHQHLMLTLTLNFGAKPPFRAHTTLVSPIGHFFVAELLV